ncbi:MAG TPA: hypothetical protein VHN20_07505 [Beijerinckiaceae bacterium]|nr:hypothetical protein [Beijerinckiaceae bacterium]
MANALEVWAASRERAARDLAKQAANLADQGCNHDAAHLRSAARSLTVKAVHERARAAALRSAA